MARRPKVEWTVRVIAPREGINQLPGVWIEQLRHMGHCKVLAENDNRSVIEFRAPHGIDDTRVWAGMESERMRSFMINAVAAPKWDGIEKVNIDVVWGN